MCDLLQFTGGISDLINTLTPCILKSELKVKYLKWIFWRPSIPKDLLGGMFEEKYFCTHRGATFEKIDFKVEIIAIFSNKRKKFPDPIMRWFITKQNPKMS